MFHYICLLDYVSAGLFWLLFTIDMHELVFDCLPVALTRMGINANKLLLKVCVIVLPQRCIKHLMLYGKNAIE